MKYKIISLLLLFLMFSCGDDAAPENRFQNTELNQWLDSIWEQKINRYPVLQTELGIRQKDDQWDDISDSLKMAEIEILMEQLKELENKFDVNKLVGQALLSYELFIYNAEIQISGADYLYNTYPVSQMRGWHNKIPSVLINQHTIRNKKDAENYISRVSKVPEVINQLIENLNARENKGIIAPTFILNHVENSIQNLISGKPLDKSDIDHTLLADFKEKINSIELTKAQREELTNNLNIALKDNFGPAYKDLLSKVSDLKKISNSDAGVWKFEDGEKFYSFKLKEMNTIEITPEEIYNTGLSEIERIHGEMKSIMDTVGFEGTLEEFFVYMKTNPDFYFPETKEGRMKYLDSAKSIINSMKADLDKIFDVQPKADLKVKAVEEFREKTAGKAFYEPPAIDGSRPGIYYANLYDMEQMPTYQMEALAYHEGIPGHHMQIAISQELEDLPKFRTTGERYVAYVEGWGLYSEYLPKELGRYSDPYSDFGRLAMELWRSCRLVVDVGIHHKKWSREKAIKFYMDNTPAAQGACTKMVDRHCVMPGQATGYKIGMNKIIELRAKAINELDKKFSIKGFHDVILKNGALPLFVLEDEVNNWIEKRKKINNEEGELNEDILILTNPGMGN